MHGPVVMSPMANSSKRKWSDVFGEREVCDKQCMMDLCTSKLQYVNPARPPRRRRTEVPLLRNVLIVNMMRHLSLRDMKIERPVEHSAEDLTVDPGHFEGLPPLSELLTDIMLDPLPNEQEQVAGSYGWTDSVDSSYSDLMPVDLGINSYIQSSDSPKDTVVHDLLPHTRSINMDQLRRSPSWHSANSSTQQSSSWSDPVSSATDSPSWVVSGSSVGGLLTSSACQQQLLSDSLETSTSELTFQPSNHPLPSFSSLFESSRCLSFAEMLQRNILLESSSAGTSGSSSSSSSISSSSISVSSFPTSTSPSADDLIGSFNLTDSELEFLAMTFSSKLSPSFEDLVHYLPQTCQPSQTYYVPSSLQDTDISLCDSATASTTTAISPCASYYRQDQPSSTVDDSSLIRVLVNL